MKKLHIVLFGTGNVGSSLIKQVLQAREFIKQQEGLEMNLPVIANSTTAFFQKDTPSPSWETDFKIFGFPYELEDVLEYVRQQHFDHLVAVDATASDAFVDNYPRLIREGFHIVAANKVANTRSSKFYHELRETLRKNNRLFLYETNVGAGLPIVETLSSLYRSHEEITRVRGVFSGSLSYIFNQFCDTEQSFSEVLTEAAQKGLTEPDPRVDLSGKDVGRKLLILGRELGLKKELKDVQVEDLVPKHLNGTSSLQHFQENQKDLDRDFQRMKDELNDNEVIRHVGELNVKSGELTVRLTREKKSSALGSLQGADSSFEVYTRSYGKQPLVIRGAGAGSAVTARGVLADLIKLAAKLN